MKYVCELCGHIYDEAVGDLKKGIPAGTEFSALTAEYECPDCGSGKEAFVTVSSGEAAVQADAENYCSQR